MHIDRGPRYQQVTTLDTVCRPPLRAWSADWPGDLGTVVYMPPRWEFLLERVYNRALTQTEIDDVVAEIRRGQHAS